MKSLPLTLKRVKVFTSSLLIQLNTKVLNLSERKVRHSLAPCCLFHISVLSQSHFAEATGVRVIRLQAVKVIKWLLVVHKIIY